MCKAQGGLVAILACESGEAVDHDCEFLKDDGEGGADEDEIRVAEMMSWKSERRQVAYQLCSLCNIARCRAETFIKRPPVGQWSAARNQEDALDDPGCRWCNRAERMHVRHDIVTSLLFLGRSDLELLRIQVLLVRWRASQLPTMGYGR